MTDAVELKKFGGLTAKAEEMTSTATETAVETTQPAAQTTQPVDESIHTATATTVSSPIESSIITAKKSSSAHVTDDNFMAEVASGNEIGDVIEFKNKKTSDNTNKLSFKDKKYKDVLSQYNKEKSEKDNIKNSILNFLSTASGTDKQNLENKISKLLDDLDNTSSFEEKKNIAINFMYENKINLSETQLESLVKTYLKGMDREIVKQHFKTIADSLDKSDSSKLSRKEKVRLYAKQAIHNMNEVKDEKQIKGLQKYAESILTKCLISDKDYSQEELAQMLGELKADIEEAKTPEERKKIIKKFSQETRIRLDLDKLEKYVAQYAKENNLSPENVKKVAARFHDMRAFDRDVALSMFKDNKEVQEMIIKAFIEDTSEGHADLMEMVSEYLGTEITQNEFEKIISSCEEFVKLQAENTQELVKSGSFSDAFKAEILEQTNKLVKLAKERTNHFITEFWQTEKGKAIKEYTRRHIAEIKEAKEEYEETQEIADKAKEEAQIAKEESEKAMAAAKEEEKKAKAIAEKMGFKDLEYEDLYKVVKAESPRQAVELEYAKAAEKKAYWAQYDAESSKRLAQSLADIAYKHLEFAKIRMYAAMQRISAAMSAYSRQ